MSCRVITRLAIKDDVVARWAVSIGHRFPFAILLILIFSNSCNAQETTLWQPSFETDGMKSEIADRISDWKRWGFIDKNGTFVISPRYDLVKPFLEENTVVCIGDRYFKIDKTGKMIGHIMTRVEVISEANNKRWAGEATEKRRENRTKYNGEIYDATGNKRLGSASECELGTFSEGLASCALSHRRPPDSIGEAENNTGYIDEHGRMVIAPRFFRAHEFQDGVANVEVYGDDRGGYASGYLNKNGQLLGGHYYGAAWDFANGLAIVQKLGKNEVDDEWGFIDKSGKELMGNWTRVGTFSGSIAGVRGRNGLWGFVDRVGKVVLPYSYKLIGDQFFENMTYVKNDEGFGFIDGQGRIVIKPSFADADYFSGGLAAVAKAVPEEEKIAALTKLQKWCCGFIDRSGNKIADGFFAARHFSEGLAAVRTGLKWGFIDDRGVLVIPAKFDDAKSFSQGLAAVLVGDRWGFVDRAGNFKIEPKFLSRDWDNRVRTYPRGFSEGFTIAQSPDYFWRFYSRDGIEALPLAVRSCLGGEPDAANFSDGLAAACGTSSNNYGYIDHNACFVIPPKLESADSFSEGMAGAGVYDQKSPLPDVESYSRPSGTTNLGEKKFGFIDTDGRFVIQPKFDQVGAFHCGLAAVARGEYSFSRDGHPQEIRVSLNQPGPELTAKWGFVDRFGKQVISMKFDNAKKFSEGLAPVQAGKKWGFIDRLGNFVISPRFDTAGPFVDGLAKVSVAGKYSFADRSGALVIKPDCLVAATFSCGRALIVTSRDPGTQISTKDEIYSMPVKSNDDILRFLIQRVSAPDAIEWAGFGH